MSNRHQTQKLLKQRQQDAEYRLGRRKIDTLVAYMLTPPPDPFLYEQPWKVAAVFEPIETVLQQIEHEGTIEVAGRQVVFRESGEWYDLVAALRGVIEFHELAASRYHRPVDLSAMVKFANKLQAGAPLFEADLAAMRACIAECKRQAMGLRVSQATDILDTVRIGIEMDRINGKAA